MFVPHPPCLLLLLCLAAHPTHNTPLHTQGAFKDFTVEWYSATGVSILTTMAANVVAPHVGLLIKALILQPLSQRRNKDKMTTQVKHRGGCVCVSVSAVSCCSCSSPHTSWCMCRLT